MTPTEKEFQEALVIVNAYIDNLNNKANSIQKTPIMDWIIKHKSSCPRSVIKTRLFTALSYYTVYGNIKHIEDLNIMQVRNIGKMSANLFNELRKLDYQ